MAYKPTAADRVKWLDATSEISNHWQKMMSDNPAFLHTYYWRLFSRMLREEISEREVTLEKARSFVPLSPEGSKRYINKALDEGLIIKGRSEADRRVTVYRLSDELRKNIEDILDRVLVAVTPIFEGRRRAA